MGEGCQNLGVCGKDENTAALQDLLLHIVKGISMYAYRARRFGAADPAIDAFTIEALYATLTNVNFDPARIIALIRQAVNIRNNARILYEDASVAASVVPDDLAGPAIWKPAATLDGLLAQSQQTLLPTRFLASGQEVVNLQELVLYGLKGAGAYAAHALALGSGSPAIFVRFHQILNFLTHPSPTADQLLQQALAVGELNYNVMEILDKAHTETFGDPQPTKVRLGARKGKAILVSGHDLHDLYALLQQTKDLGIQVYTHGEMLPAHGYPKLKALAHLAGNYGGAWWEQANEFDAFPGAILMTSNCIQKPKLTYQERIFTSGIVGWPDVQHISNQDFTPVIAAALAAPGFAEDGSDEEITVGFAHHAVLSAAGKVVDAVKSGAIRHFFLIGGCDGARSARKYYTELAEAVPDDCLILTLGCGKYRFNKLDFGEIEGLPRLLDLGQCNDAYSALQIALALAKAFNCGVNELPLSLVLSWYEQKAVAILLTLLHLGVRNIRIGPTLPAFLSPQILTLLHEKFNLMAIKTPQEDLAAILA